MRQHVLPLELFLLQFGDYGPVVGCREAPLFRNLPGDILQFAFEYR